MRTPVRAIGQLWTAFLADSLRARFARGAFWAVTGTLISQGLLLASSVLVARFLGKQGFGELGIIRATVGMFGVLVGLRLGLTATKHVAEFRTSDPLRAGRIIALSSIAGATAAAVGAGLLLVASPYLATHTIQAPHLTPVLMISAGLLFCNTLAGVQQSVLAGLEAFKTIAKVNVACGVIGFPSMVAGVYFWGLPGVVAGLVAAAAAGCLINYAVLGHETRKAGIHVTCRGFRSQLPMLWTFSLPAFLSAALVGPVMWLAGTMLVRQPDGYAEMGLFEAANRWGRMLLILPGLLGAVAMPILSERLGAGDGTQMRRTLRICMLTNAALVIPLAVVLAAFSPWVMSLYGAEFAVGWPILMLVLAAAVLMALQTSAGQIITATGQMWLGVAMNLGWAVALLASCRLLLDAGWGAFGMGAAYLAGYGVHSVWVFLFVHRVLHGRTYARPRRSRRDAETHNSGRDIRDEPCGETAVAVR
ncbi:MAG: oligosaccharide flippase family protein [Verrucomicrobia bacterium]|nr:oligosaccharide flippase family protein [Verrucomicrobiota bacterium]